VGLLEEAMAEGLRPGPECSVLRALQEFPKQAGDIEKIIRNHQISNAAAARVFQRNGIDLTDSTLSRHRNGNCRTCIDRGYVW
jgi:hypothetical protein